jgi:hypothetical protein
MHYTVTLSSAATFPVTVDYTTADGTAVAGTDYTATDGTLTFAPGETSKTIDVTVNGNSVSPSETVDLNLSNASNGTISAATGVGTINAVEDLSDNTDGPPEPGVGYALTAASFKTGASAVDLDSVSVGYMTRPDSVKIYTDNSGQPGSVVGTLTYSDGMYTASGITLDANTTYWVVNAGGGWWSTIPGAGTGDGYLGGALNSGNGGASWSDATDAGAYSFVMQVKTSYVGPSISISPASVQEEIGNNTTQTMHFAVTLSSAATFPVTVHYATGDVSVPSGDYTPTSGTLTFAPGETSKTIDVTVNANSSPYSDETFYVSLSSPTNGTVVVTSGTGTIQSVETLSDNLAEPQFAWGSVQAGGIARAQAFSTGSASAVLQSITAMVQADVDDIDPLDPSTFVLDVGIYSDNSGNPGSLVGTLTSPVGYSTDTENVTFGGNGIALNAYTQYWFVAKASAGNFGIVETTSSSGNGAGFVPTGLLSWDSGTTWSSSFVLQLKIVASGVVPV